MELNEIIMRYCPSIIDDGNKQGQTYLYTVSFSVWLIKQSWSAFLIMTLHIFSSDNLDMNSARRMIKWSWNFFWIWCNTCFLQKTAKLILPPNVGVEWNYHEIQFFKNWRWKQKRTNLPLHCIFWGVTDQMNLERFADSDTTPVFPDNVDMNSAPKCWNVMKLSWVTVLQKLMMKTHKEWSTFTLYLLRCDWSN